MEAERSGVRRLCALYEGLPADAATARVDGQQWTVRDELLAVAIERIDLWGWVNARLNTDKKSQEYLPDKPLEIRRPGEEQEGDGQDRVITDPAEIAAFFGT